MSSDEARARFRASEVARLATVGAQGRPHLVPIVFVVWRDRIYSVVDTKPKRTTALRRLANVRANPSVAVIVDYYDGEDWDALWWARADGTGRVLAPDDSEGKRALRRLAARYPRQRPVGEVLAIDVERWSGWAASERA